MLALPAMAQEQRGAIEGTVKDSSGAVLPGATVEAKSASGTVITTTSDANGVFRFNSLAPATYEVTASLQGFSPSKAPSVLIGLGEIKRVDLALAVGGLTDTVTVSSESPLVDVKQTARQTNIRAEQIDLLPHGRDFTTIASQAAGVNQEAKLGGISMDGASAAENRFIVDGMETTNLQSGLSGQGLIMDFVEEMQIKSSGYTSEYGGALGGVISAVTKSGTNDWHGSGIVNWQGNKTEGGRNETLRLNLTNTNAAEYVTYPEDSYNRYETGFTVGGPIVKNRAWFFGGYLPAFTPTTRNVDAASASNPKALGGVQRPEEHRAEHRGEPDGSAQRHVPRRASPTTTPGTRRTGCCRR